MKKESLIKILPLLALLGTLIGVGTPLYFNAAYPDNGYWFFAVSAALLCLMGLVFGYFGFVSGARMDKKFFKFMNKLGVTLPNITEKQVEDSRIFIKLRGYLTSTYGGTMLAGLVLVLIYKQTNELGFLLFGALLMILAMPFLFMFLYYDYKMLKNRLPQLTFIQYILLFAPISQ
jgi:hypothetical protein